MKNIPVIISVMLLISSCSSNSMGDLFKNPDNEIITQADPISKLYVPVI